MLTVTGARSAKACIRPHGIGASHLIAACVDVVCLFSAASLLVGLERREMRGATTRDLPHCLHALPRDNRLSPCSG